MKILQYGLMAIVFSLLGAIGALYLTDSVDAAIQRVAPTQGCWAYVSFQGVEGWAPKGRAFCDGFVSASPSPTGTNTTIPPTATVSPSPTNTPTSTSIPPTATPDEGGIVVSPGQTIQSAVTSAPAGSTIRVRAGVYNERVNVTKPLTFVAYGDGTPIVDGQCTRASGFVISQVSDVTIQGFEVRNTRGSSVQVDGLNADHISLLDNALHDFNCANQDNTTFAGASFYYSGSHMRVVGNTIVWRAGMTVRPAQAMSSNGIWFKSNSENPSGGFHTVTDNVIIGGWDGIGGEGEDDPHGVWDGNPIVLRNQVSLCWDDGISAEGYTGGGSFSDNTITDCGIGIANASNSNYGEVRFERNVIRSTLAGYYGNQLCFKVGNGGNQVAYIVGTTCVLSGGDGISQTNSGLATLIVTDNCWNTGRYIYEFTSVPATGSLFDRNTLYTTDAGRFVKWGGNRYYSLVEFQSATGQETNSVIGTCN